MVKINQRGQGMTEYILIVALIAVVAIGAVKLFGHKIDNGFKQAADKVGNAVGSR